MVYWIEFGNGFRERGKDSLVKTRRYAVSVLEGNRGLPYAYIFPSKDSMTMEGVISTHDGLVWFSKKSRKWYDVRKDGTLRMR